MERYTTKFVEDLAAAGDAFRENGLYLYECFGVFLFPIYGMTGGLCSDLVFYITDETKGDKVRCLPVRLLHSQALDMDGEAINRVVTECANSFLELSHLVNLNGGELGLDGLDLRERGKL